ncbi:MAG: DUF1993 domain-containing protein [Litorimonas sp.]
MTTLSMSNAISVLPKLIGNLEHILKKAEANAEERGIEMDVFLNSRLAPDMHPLYKQVLMVCDLAKMAPYRIAGLTPPTYDDSERSLYELYGLISKAKTDIQAVTADQLDGREGVEFMVKMGPRGEMPFTGIVYLSAFTLPNLHFHITTAYNILRHNGVPLGKFDYFGGSL